MSNDLLHTSAPAANGQTTKPASDYQTIDAFLETTILALTNAQLPDIYPLLSNRGYDQQELTARLADAQALRTLNEKQKAEYGEQYEATRVYNEARHKLHEEYIDHIRLARVIFKHDTAAKTALGLRGKRAGTQTGYVNGGLLFYNNAMSKAEYIAALQQKGISESELKAGQEGFLHLQVLIAAQRKETGEAQQATSARDAAYDRLYEWMSDFYETARVALRKTPQLMRQIGI